MSSRFEALVADYEASREDFRAMEAGRLNIVGFLLTAIGLTAAVIARDCRTNVSRVVGGTGCAQDEPQLADFVLAGIPLVPLTLLTYLVLQSVTLSLKSLYLRRLEREIRFLIEPAPSRDELSPAWAEIEVEMARITRRSLVGPLTLILVAASLLLFGGVTALVIATVDVLWRVLMLLVYAAAVGLVLQRAMRVALHGRAVYLDLEANALAEVATARLDRRTPTQGRTLVHLLPRSTVDFTFKGLITVGGSAVFLLLHPLAISSLADHELVLTLARVLTVAVVFEVGIYQARYLLNDLAGLDEDRARPDRAARRRLGAYYASRLEALTPALVNVTVRVVVSVALILWLTPEAWTAFLASLLTLVVTALMYDRLREVVPSTRSSETWTALGLHLLVGTGYTIRAGLGFVAARELVGWLSSTHELWVLLLFVDAFGIMFVALSWALDAFSYVDAPLRVRDPASRMVGVQVRETLWSKPQLSVHVRGVGLLRSTTRRYSGLPDDELAGSFARPLADGDRWCPWRLVPTVLAAAVAVAWVPFAASAPAWLLVPAVLVGAFCGLALGRADRTGRRLIALAGTIVVVVVALVLADIPAAVAACVPWLITVALSMGFRTVSRDEMLHGLPDMIGRLRGVGEVVLLVASKVLLGARVAEELYRARTPPTPPQP